MFDLQTNHTYEIASVDIALEELDSSGDAIDRHSIATFASQEFSVTVQHESSFGGVAAVKISLSSTVVDVDGNEYGEVGIEVFVFTAFGTAVSPSGDESWWVGPGDTKFTVDVTHWDFCDSGETTCCVVDGDGAALQLVVTVAPGDANPADGVLVNRARRMLKKKNNDDDDDRDDDVARGCVEAASPARARSRRSLSDLHTSVGKTALRSSQQAATFARRALKRRGKSNDNDDDDDDDKDDDDDDDDDTDAEPQAHCFVFSKDSDLVISSQVFVDGTYLVVNPTTVQTPENSTEVTITFPKFSDSASYDPIISAFQVDEAPKAVTKVKSSARAADVAYSTSAVAVTGTIVTVAAVVVIGVIVVAVVLRLRTQRRGVKAVVASHHASPSKLPQKYDNVDLKTDISL